MKISCFECWLLPKKVKNIFLYESSKTKGG